MKDKYTMEEAVGIWHAARVLRGDDHVGVKGCGCVDCFLHRKAKAWLKERKAMTRPKEGSNG